MPSTSSRYIIAQCEECTFATELYYITGGPAQHQEVKPKTWRILRHFHDNSSWEICCRCAEKLLAQPDFFVGIRILNKNYKEKVCLRSELLSAMIKIFKGPFIIYTLGGGGDSYVIYKNIAALPPLDDLNVEDPPPYKILKNLYTPPFV